MSDPVVPVLEQVLTTLPVTRRGFGLSLSTISVDDTEWLCYPSKKYVMIRNLSDPTKGGVFSGHKQDVYVAAFSPDGKLVASAGKSGKLLIWGREDMLLKKELGCPADTYDIAWSADSQSLVACGKGTGATKIVILNVATEEPVGKCVGHNKSVLSVAWKDGSIVTGGEDFTIRNYLPNTDVDEGYKQNHKHDKAHEAYVNCLRWSPDGKLVASCGGKSLAFYDASDLKKKPRKIKNAHKGSIYSLSWSSCGKYLLTGSADKTCKVWDVEEQGKKAIKTFQFPNKTECMQLGVAWEKDHLVSVGLDGVISKLDFKGDQENAITSYMGVADAPCAFAKDPTSPAFFVGIRSGAVCSFIPDEGWKNSTGKKGSVPKGYLKDIVCSCDGEFVYIGGNDKKVYTCEAKTMEISETTVACKGSIVAMAASSKDPTLIACALNNDTVAFIKNGSIIKVEKVNFEPWCLQFNQDDTAIAIGPKKKRELYLFDYDASSSSIKLAHTFRGVVGEPTAIRWKIIGENSYVSVSTSKSLFLVYNVKTKVQENDSGWEYHGGKVNGHAWSPSGDYVASVAADQDLFIWSDTKNFGDDRKEAKLAHIGGALYTAWIDDANVLSVGNSGVVKVWHCEKES